MADAKDILGLPKTSSSEKRSKPPKESVKKPDGVSREVYALTGGLPPIMPAIDSAALKKRQSTSSKKISWQWLPFTSSARTDNLQLCHWVKVVDGVPPTGDYDFAKFNKIVDIIHYTDEEYNKYLVDANWSRQDTDQLFGLCEQFDLRFIVIADRFHRPRSVEELKGRYYSAAKIILLARAGAPEDVADHTLVKDSYNMAHETERKHMLGSVLSQSQQQEGEDMEVLAKTKSISEPKVNVKNQGSDDVTAAGTALSEDAVEKTPSTPARPGSPSPLHPPRPTAATTVPSGPKLPRLYLRFAMLSQIIHGSVPAGGARTAKRVDQMLEELGVRTKPRVATQAVCSEHLELRKEVVTLLNLQKQLQWKEADVSLLRDNPYGDIPPTPSTSKKSHRGGGDIDRASRRTVAVVEDTYTFSVERSGKRDYKRKVPARFTETPPSPPHNKRAHKMKASD